MWEANLVYFSFTMYKEQSTENKKQNIGLNLKYEVKFPDKVDG